MSAKSFCVQYASFLVRLWRATGEDTTQAPTGWQSEVEHIQSGQRWTFQSLEDLQEFLRQETEHPEILEWMDTYQEM